MAAETEKHLYDLVKHFGTALVITRRSDGEVHARPMAVAQLQAGLDAYFTTSINSPKVAEIEADPRVAIAFQSTSEDAVVYGKATIVRDRALIHKLWSESLAAVVPRWQGRSVDLPHPRGRREGRVLGSQRRRRHQVPVRSRQVDLAGT